MIDLKTDIGVLCKSTIFNQIISVNHWVYEDFRIQILPKIAFYLGNHVSKNKTKSSQFY